MKKWRGSNISDRKWITIICLLLVVEIIWLLADLHLISLPFRSSGRSSTGAVEAGHIIRSQEDVKKRGSDSLIWEPAKKDDVLYYHDSVLTLGQSTATLYLKDQTELQMAENTLVTFEEPEAQSNAEIRLRFAKGDLKARNPFATSKIETTDWVVHLEKGAELAMRKEQSGGYEFEVLAGHATLNTDTGKQDLIESKIIKLNDDKKIETIDKSLNLKWTEPDVQRVYTFGDTATVPLEWSGKAQKLQIVKPDEEKPEPREESVRAEQASAKVQLTPGNYQIRLSDAGGISSPKTVEVVKAPKIYLKKPLPRDRIQIGTPLEFVWESEKPLKDYNLKLSNGQNFDVTDNFKAVQFDKEQDIIWTIEAHDADGFKVPSMYESKVYLRNDALAAPKLKKPRVVEEESAPEGGELKKAPARKTKNSKQKNSGWLELLENTFANFAVEKLNRLASFETHAEAQVLRKKNVVFEWEPVEGANQYIIEISSDPEFKTPEVVETLKKTQYVWKKYDPKKKYFWRVASGNSNGRMGLFSDPTPLEVVVESVDASVEGKNISVRKEAEEKAAEAAAAAKAAREKEQASKEGEKKEDVKPTYSLQPEKPLYSGAARWSIAYAPGFKVASIPGEQNTKIDLSGAVPVAADFKYRTSDTEDRIYFFDWYLSSQTWKSKTSTAFAQPDLKYNESILSFRTAEKDSSWQFGLSAHAGFYGKIEGLAITNENQNFIGVEAAKIFSPNWTGELALMAGGNFNEVKLAGLYKDYFASDENSEYKYFYGVNLISILQSGPYGSGHQSQIQVLLGISGF